MKTTATTDFPAALTRAEISVIESAAADVTTTRNQARRMALELLTKSRYELAEKFRDSENIETAFELAETFKRTLQAMDAERNWIETALTRLIAVIDAELDAIADKAEGEA